MTEIMKNRIERLNLAIKDSGKTYTELEKITGIAKSSLQRYATYQTDKISIDNFERLATALNVNIKWLLCWDNDSFINTDSGTDDISKRFLSLSKNSQSEFESYLAYLEWRDKQK